MAVSRLQYGEDGPQRRTLLERFQAALRAALSLTSASGAAHGAAVEAKQREGGRSGRTAVRSGVAQGCVAQAGSGRAARASISLLQRRVATQRRQAIECV